MSFKTLKSDWAFIILATLVFVIGLAVAVWDFIQLQKTIWSLGLLNGTGLAAFLGGFVLRQVGKRTLGRSYSYGLRTLEDQKLVQHGVYRYIRHPITFASIIYKPAISLVLSSLYRSLAMLGNIALLLYRIRIEEKIFIEEFRSEYIQYMKRTKRLIPFIY